LGHIYFFVPMIKNLTNDKLLLSKMCNSFELLSRTLQYVVGCQYRMKAHKRMPSPWFTNGI